MRNTLVTLQWTQGSLTHRNIQGAGRGKQGSSVVMEAAPRAGLASVVWVAALGRGRGLVAVAYREPARGRHSHWRYSPATESR